MEPAKRESEQKRLLKTVIEANPDFNIALERIIEIAIKYDRWRSPEEPLSIYEILYLKKCHQIVHSKAKQNSAPPERTISS